MTGNDVDAPRSRREWGQGLSDFRKIVVYLLSSLSVVVYYATAWWLIGKEPEPGVVIPLSAPPRDFEPAYIGYIKRLKYSPELLMADITYLAVEGYLEMLPITKKLRLLRTDKEVDDTLSPALRSLLAGLFPEGRRETRLGGQGQDPLCEDQEFTNDLIRKMQEAYKTFGSGKAETARPELYKYNVLPCLLGVPLTFPLFRIARQFDEFAYFTLGYLAAATVAYYLVSLRKTSENLEQSSAAIYRRGTSGRSFGYNFHRFMRPLLTNPSLWLILGFFLVPALITMTFLWGPFFGICSIAALSCAGLFSANMPARTKIGRQYFNEVESFELYLTVAEKHHIEMRFPASSFGRMPPRTVAISERNLPYAIALGTANTWIQAFAKTLYPPERR